MFYLLQENANFIIFQPTGQMELGYEKVRSVEVFFEWTNTIVELTYFTKENREYKF